LLIATRVAERQPTAVFVIGVACHASGSASRVSPLVVTPSESSWRTEFF